MNGTVGGIGSDSSECWKIIHIPEKPPVLPHFQATVELLASEIEPKHANNIVRKLNHIAPLEGLRHVKRIKKICLDGGKSQLFVILCTASGNNVESNCMPGDVLELVNTYQLSTFTTKAFVCPPLYRVRDSLRSMQVLLPKDILVCKYAASTKEEWEEQCKQWPTSFHPPTYNIDGITGFSEEDSVSVFNFMKHAVSMSKSGTSVVNAAIIVDPSTREVISSSCDHALSRDAPTHSSSTESWCSKGPEETIEYNVNQMEKDPISQTKCSSSEAKQSYKDVTCLHPWGWIEQRLHSSFDSWHPLQHAAILAIEKSAARDRQLFPANDQAVDFAQEDYNVSRARCSPLKRQKVNPNAKDDDRTDCQRNVPKCNSTRPYLCTGYDIYFVWEPCVMCSMAIVHQRIRRVFYAFPNPNDGALGSVHRLQGERSLNHHYAVFRVMLPEEVLN